MITARIQIEDGQILDTYEGWGFIVMGNGDDKKHFAPPEKKRDKSSYPEEAGAHEDPRTVDDEFDYKIQFLIEAPNRNLVNANSKIKAWNDAVRERTAESDVKRCKTVTLYDDRMRTKIVGIPEIIHEVGEKDFFRRQDGSVMDCVVATLTIHVSDPMLCDFNAETDGKQEMPIRISLRTDGKEIYVDTSRPLEDDEVPVLLWHGVRRNRISEAPAGGDLGGNHGGRRYRSKYRWHVSDAHVPIEGGRVKAGMLDADNDNKMLIWRGDSYLSLGQKLLVGDIIGRVYRGNRNYYKLTAARPRCRLIFGVAIYCWDRMADNRQKRLSNVAYFHKTSILTDDVISESLDVE